MQIIHVTYRWPSSNGPAELRIREAHQSWADHSNPDEYTPAHFTNNTVKFHSRYIGDKQPYPITNMIIDQGFMRRNDDNAMVCFTNSDIKLIKGTWNFVRAYAQNHQTHYEDCVHTRPRKKGEATSTPVTFFFSYRWWAEYQKFLPPVLFACPYWERPLQLVMDRTTEATTPNPPCTEHVPHRFWSAYNNWRTPARNYNAALAKGWETLNLDRPSLGRGVRWK